MKLFISVVLWVILLAISWPLAIVLLLLFPLIWLLSIPFRVIGLAVNFVFELLGFLFRLPFRVLGAKI